MSIIKITQGTISQSEFAYNDIGKITDANETLFGGTKRYINYGYDQAGYLEQIDYPNGGGVNITPDWAGRIDTVKAGLVVTVATYKYIGSRVRQRYYDWPGVTYQATYDNLGRITSADSGASDVKFDYTYIANENNIYRQTFDHRDSDPYNEYSYDNLDRLMQVEYLSDSGDNEVFTMDDLGNRSNVNARDGNDVVYSINNLTNRYNSVGGASLTYDTAGNLTKDKNAYEYEYDYENRIVKVTKASSDIAEFTYDALGRRIRKIDSVANETRLYYYNDKWQVLCDANEADIFQQAFIYGNYIDEVLLAGGTGGAYYYLHDHLYSPVALTDTSGDVVERYEYDVYGNCYVQDPNHNPRTTSQYDNPYYFTGRRLDFLDNGSLEHYHYRHRTYDTYTGRFTTHDPLPYVDGMNLYEYVQSNPVMNVDPFGLMSDQAFFIKFMWHRYFGLGGLWTAGAENVKRQSKVKEETGKDLKILALKRCRELSRADECHREGKVRLNIPYARADDTIWMKLSLYGPDPAYLAMGGYKAKRYGKDGKCACEVTFNNKYEWLDVGDLNLKLDWAHAADWIELGLEETFKSMIGLARFAVCMDFPIYIKWREESTCTKVEGGPLECSGWPFE